jgi:hypothetical protein
MFVAVVTFGVVAACEPVARLVQAAAKPPRRLMACHVACDHGTPRATPGPDEDHDEETAEGSD